MCSANAIGGSRVAVSFSNIGRFISSNVIRSLRNSACLSVICLARALNRQFPSPKTLSTFLLVRDRNGSIIIVIEMDPSSLLGLSDMLVVAGRSGRLIHNYVNAMYEVP